MVARLLAAGVPVQVWNRSPWRLEPLTASGATILQAGAESTAPVMFSLLANDEALDALVDSADGPLKSATPPTVWVDCSTVSVRASRRAAAAARRVGAAFVCAPVSGNPNVVRAGKLTLVASGEQQAVRTRGELRARSDHPHVSHGKLRFRQAAHRASPCAVRVAGCPLWNTMTLNSPKCRT